MRYLDFALISLCLLILASCQTTEGQPEARDIEVCDASGCRIQSSATTTFDPSDAVPDDDPDGILPILEAEAKTDPRAAFDLGLRYMRGDGIRQNSWLAITWMRDAAERGELRAQSALGRLYLTGLEETGADFNEAQRWLSIAAGRGDQEAAELLSEAEAGKAEQQANYDSTRYYNYGTFWYPITVVDRWRRVYTMPYWYRTRYYGYWRRGLLRYSYY
ncbi:MAG: sel1 repeat family protein [Pseudomonadota bacterium]